MWIWPEICNHSLFYIFRWRGVTWVCGRCRRVCVADFVECAGGADGADNKARFPFQVKTLQVAHDCIPTHLQNLQTNLPLEFACRENETPKQVLGGFVMLVISLNFSFSDGRLKQIMLWCVCGTIIHCQGSIIKQNNLHHVFVRIYFQDVQSQYAFND